MKHLRNFIDRTIIQNNKKNITNDEYKKLIKYIDELLEKDKQKLEKLKSTSILNFIHSPLKTINLLKKVDDIEKKIDLIKETQIYKDAYKEYEPIEINLALQQSLRGKSKNFQKTKPLLKKQYIDTDFTTKEQIIKPLRRAKFKLPENFSRELKIISEEKEEEKEEEKKEEKKEEKNSF